MNKRDFERQKQMLWVYLRNQGKCAVCSQKVDPHEDTISKSIPVALGIDHLLRVRLVHSRCEATRGGWTRELSAA